MHQIGISDEGAEESEQFERKTGLTGFIELGKGRVAANGSKAAKIGCQELRLSTASEARSIFAALGAWTVHSTAKSTRLTGVLRLPFSLSHRSVCTKPYFLVKSTS